MLRVLIGEEVIGSDADTHWMRRKTAAFPTGKTLASWRPEESFIPRSHPERTDHIGVDRTT